MTALGRAEEFLSKIVDLGCPDPETCDLPGKRYAALGAIVVDCETVVVSATSMLPYIDPQQTVEGFRCAPPQLTTITGVISRECEGGYDEEGFTLTDEYTAAAAQSQTDADLLWDAVWAVQNFMGPTDVSIGWSIEGALWIASVQYTIGVV